MQHIRASKIIARLVLALYFLCVGTAIASPLVAPKQMQLICSAGGMIKLLVTSDDGTPVHEKMSMDCPLCMAIGPAPAFASIDFDSAQPLGYFLQSIPAARIAALTAAPFPPRGPPLHS